MRKLGIASIRELARRADTHHAILSKWMNGKQGISKAVALRVAQVLGVSPKTLFFDWSPDGDRR
jgi:plasmid maintenance system antidote protein VapI